MGDWIGSGRKAKGREEWLSYEKAQKIVVKFAFSQPKKYVEWHHETRPLNIPCLLYTSPSPRDGLLSRMPSSA